MSDASREDRSRSPYARIIVELKDSVTGSCSIVHTTKARLLKEGSDSFFGCWLRQERSTDRCVIHLLEEYHSDFEKYLSKYIVANEVGVLADVFGLQELASRVKPYQCVNCQIWVDPNARDASKCIFKPRHFNNCALCNESRFCDCTLKLGQHVKRPLRDRLQFESDFVSNDIMTRIYRYRTEKFINKKRNRLTVKFVKAYGSVQIIRQI